MSRKRETQAQQTCRLLDAGSYVLPDTGRRVALAEPTRKGTVHEDASKLVPAAATVAPAVQVRVIKASAFSAAAQLVLQQQRQQQQGAAAAVGAPARRKRRNGAQGSRRDQRRKSGSSGSGGGVAVLDFASDSEPGGGWRGKQQGTQEEALCRASSLGRALEHLEYPLQQYGVAVVPEVVVFRTDDRACNLLPQPFVVGVVAAALRECGAEGGHKHRSHLRRKVQSVLAAAAHHGFTRLVLGAWGCGAFGNEPAAVAGAFAAALAPGGGFEGAFHEVVFAHPRGGKCFAAFQHAMASLVPQPQQLEPEPEPEPEPETERSIELPEPAAPDAAAASSDAGAVGLALIRTRSERERCRRRAAEARTRQTQAEAAAAQLELADTMGQIRSAMASLSDQDGMMRDGSAAASAAASAQVAPDPRSDDPAAAAAAAAEEVWVPAHDPRCHRVKLLESQGELAAAAQLMRLLLAEMDPRAQRPKLRRYLRHLTDQIRAGQRGR